MGKTTADIQREITLQRELIERRIRDLEDRVSDDVRDTGRSVSHKFDSAAQSVDDKLHISEQVEQRPLTAVAGAFGVGVLLGMISDRGSESKGRAGNNRSKDGSNDGILASLLSAASGLVGGKVSGEVQGLLEDVFRELRGDGREPRSFRSDAPETRFRARYYRDEYENDVDGGDGATRYERSGGRDRVPSGNGAA